MTKGKEIVISKEKQLATKGKDLAIKKRIELTAKGKDLAVNKGVPHINKATSTEVRLPSKWFRLPAVVFQTW